jgi:hypothetical protein
MVVFMACIGVLLLSVEMSAFSLLSVLKLHGPGKLESLPLFGQALVFGFAHPVWYVFLGAVLGTLGCLAYVYFAKSWDMALKSSLPVWQQAGLVLVIVLSLPFLAMGLVATLVFCMGWLFLGGVRWLRMLPGHVRFKLDQYLSNHPEAMAHQEKKAIEETLPPATHLSSPRRL